MKAKLCTVAAALFAISSLPAVANDIKWDEVSVGYEALEIDDTPIKLSGLTLGGTKTFADNFFATASFSSTSDDVDVLDGEIELDETRVGLGYFFTATKGLDLFVRASYVNQKFSFEGESVTDKGWGAAIGARYAVTPIFELGATIEHLDIEDVTDTKYTVEGRLAASNSIAVVAKYHLYDDADGYYLGVSYYF